MKFFVQAGEQKAPQNQADDFGPYVLDIGGGVEPQCTGGVAQKAGDAESHIDGIAEEHQEGGQDAD